MKNQRRKALRTRNIILGVKYDTGNGVAVDYDKARSCGTKKPWLKITPMRNIISLICMMKGNGVKENDICLPSNITGFPPIKVFLTV